jgi:oligopeptide/dipeptide ABC transporter ATP-binding protein
LEDPAGATTESPEEPALVVATNLRRHFRLTSAVFGTHGPMVPAVDGVSFDIRRGETWGLVGESGSGKSTTARLVLRLLDVDEGSIVFDGRDITGLRGGPLRALRSEMQAVFQDVAGSLDPRMTVISSVAEPLQAHRHMSRSERADAAREMLAMVGLSGGQLGRYSYELSGGQRQRVVLARAMVLRPKLLVLDEPTSALDVSTRARVIDLLRQLQGFGAAYFLVAHDLDFVHHLSDRIAVMYLGQIVEMGTAAQVYLEPRHPYTEALLAAKPRFRTGGGRVERILLRGDAPPPTAMPSGCRFHTRCPYAWERCRTEPPPLRVMDDGGTVACHLHDDGPRLGGRSVRLANSGAANGRPATDGADGYSRPAGQLPGGRRGMQ